MKDLEDKKTIQERLIEVRNLISIDLEKAKNILQSVIVDNKNDFYLMEINYVRNMIKEEELFQELTVEQKKHYQNLKAVAKDFYVIGDYESAYNYYEFAKDKTNHPIFDYYLGKILYKQGKYEESLCYLQEYYSHGGKKLSKCLLYMIKIFQVQGHYKKGNKLSSKLQKLEDTFKSDFYFRRYRRHQNDPHNDCYKRNMSKKTIVDIDEFMSQEEVDNILYNQYDFHQKLEVIKELMIQNQFQRAESYLHNLTPETGNDYKELEQFHRNKKLYKNKRR